MQPHTNPYTAMAGSLHDPILKIVCACRVCIPVRIHKYGNTLSLYLSYRDFCCTRTRIRTNENVP